MRLRKALKERAKIGVQTGYLAAYARTKPMSERRRIANEEYLWYRRRTSSPSQRRKIKAQLYKRYGVKTRVRHKRR